METYLPIIIAFIVGLFAIYQVRLNYTSNYRLKWIEGFRESVSTFICEINEFNITVSKIVRDQKRTGIKIDDQHPDMIRFYDSIKNSTLYINQLLLYLDPNETEHKSIISAIMMIESHCKGTDLLKDDLTQIVGKEFDTLLKLSQIEISRQWGKSKKLI